MADEFKIGKLTFVTTSASTVELEDAEKNISKVNLTKTINHQGKTYTVASIGYKAFANCTALKSVKIPYGIKEIGEYAFAGCTSLSSFFVFM